MIVVGLKAYCETGNLAWGPTGVVTGATSLYDSKYNTDTLVALGPQYEAATWCASLDVEGCTDYVFPARNELEVAYYNLKNVTHANYVAAGNLGNNANAVPPWEPVATNYTAARPAQTTVDAFKVGGVEAFADNYFWSSSEYSSTYAWYELFRSGDPGTQGGTTKTRAYPVRRSESYHFNLT